MMSMMLSSWRVCCVRVPQRWVFAMMRCLALTTAYAMRICMSLVITEMVATAKTSSNNTSSENTCAAPTESTWSNSSSGGTYDWDEYTQGIILSSFYWGYITVMVNPNDLSSNYTGTLMALLNAIGALAGILVPYVIGLLRPNQTLSEWRLVFWITFGLFLVGAVIFHIWADGEVQYWNDVDSEIDQRINVESKRQANEDDIFSPKRPNQEPVLS